jgi:hypothetical protein
LKVTPTKLPSKEINEHWAKGARNIMGTTMKVGINGCTVCSGCCKGEVAWCEKSRMLRFGNSDTGEAFHNTLGEKREDIRMLLGNVKRGYAVMTEV